MLKEKPPIPPPAHPLFTVVRGWGWGWRMPLTRKDMHIRVSLRTMVSDTFLTLSLFWQYSIQKDFSLWRVCLVGLVGISLSPSQGSSSSNYLVSLQHYQLLLLYWIILGHIPRYLNITN